MIDKSDIFEALEGIRANGALTPSRVVRVAAKIDSILHPLFEWDDVKAGHQFRLAQARTLIATRIVRGEHGAMPIRAYIHVPSPNGEGEYLAVQSIVNQPDKLALARAAAIRLLASAEEGIAELDEAVRLFGRPERSDDQQARAKRARGLVQEAQTQLVGL